MIELQVSTTRRTDMVDVTAQVQQAVARLQLEQGAVVVFCPHTTAGVTINESADPAVARDIAAVLERLVPWQGSYEHAEGNAAAHVRASLLGSSVWVPVAGGSLRLGRWQGIFLAEFDGPRRRTLWVSPLPG